MYTKNNNQSMKTVVETFVIEETQELIYDNEKLDEWNTRVAELGLKGQTKIVKSEKSPIPFMHMKATTVRVFETLCPRKVNITEYDKTPIPVEILNLVGLSVKEEYFSKIEIWYDDENPDPACVGHLGDFYTYGKNYQTLKSGFKTEAEAKREKDSNPEVHDYQFRGGEKYLLGRWADVKMSLESLTAKAKNMYVANARDEQNQKIIDAKRALEDLEIKANQHFGFSSAPEPELLF